MRSRSSAEHQQAVARRLALLSAELARVVPGDDVPEAGGTPEGPPVESPVGDPLAARVADPATGQVVEPVPGLVPQPGRHAARRRRQAWAQALPEPMRGRVSLGPGQLAVVAVLVAAGLAVTCWWIVRGDPEPATPSSAAVSSSTPGGLLAEASAAPLAEPLVEPVVGSAAANPNAAPASVTVDVAGKVRRPGIAVLAPGARVVDAIEAAGGAKSGVDLTSLNLARVLADGEQILVGVTPPTGVAVEAASAVAGGTPSTGGLVSLNTATLAELETLPQVGPVTAQAILDWRSEHGGFTAVDELLEVDGIGEVTLGRIAPHVTL